MPRHHASPKLPKLKTVRQAKARKIETGTGKVGKQPAGLLRTARQPTVETGQGQVGKQSRGTRGRTVTKRTVHVVKVPPGTRR